MTPENVPYLFHEAAQARAERTIKRLIAVIVLLIVLLFACIIYESQFEDVVTTETVTQESDAKDGGTAIVNNGGDLNYGESSADSNKND
jgi:multisubunit Na+/H+ antiporter MnhB subunit